jgi:hypothetical protein
MRFLDKNISRLLGEDAKKPQQSTFSLFNIRSFFGEALSDATQPLEIYLQDLISIAWVPVIVTPLHVCMPWPWMVPQQGADLHDTVDTSTSTSTLRRAYSLAAPLDVRPSNEAWLCSASKRLALPLSGAEQDYDRPLAISTSLKKTLGWAEPLDAHTVAMQLREVAKVSVASDVIIASSSIFY